MRFPCWIPKATNAHSEQAVLIAFPLQQWLHERASMLRYTYIACLVFSKNELVEKITALLSRKLLFWVVIYVHIYIYIYRSLKKKNFIST